MSRNKRLFLFAGYDKDAIIDDALVYYASKLSQCGDVIFCMDCDCAKSEINKIKPFSIYQISGRHGEYDFGSYKRCFELAKVKDILKNYEYLYLINDSVFGPMIDLKPILEKMEKSSTDAIGLIESKHKTHSFIESWFVGLNRKVFLSTWFDEFISSVQKEQYKFAITVKYEHGLTNLIKNHNCSWSCLYPIYGRETYNKPKYLFKCGCPFIKKASFTRHNGALGGQIKYIFKHSDNKAMKSVMKTANRLYGKEYMKQFLTFNPIKILWRNITYGIKKIKSGEI